MDSTRPVTLITQFITSDGTDNGDLVEIRRVWVQNGQTIQNTKVNWPGVAAYDSITDQMCTDTKNLFGDEQDFGRKGGLKAMGDSLNRGQVLALSLWDDHYAYMLWLDSLYPADSNPATPGNLRGPCPTTGGRPSDVERDHPNSSVVFSNLKIGTIGSTF